MRTILISLIALSALLSEGVGAEKLTGASHPLSDKLLKELEGQMPSWPSLAVVNLRDVNDANLRKLFPDDSFYKLGVLASDPETELGVMLDYVAVVDKEGEVTFIPKSGKRDPFFDFVKKRKEFVKGDEDALGIAKAFVEVYGLTRVASGFELSKQPGHYLVGINIEMDETKTVAYDLVLSTDSFDRLQKSSSFKTREKVREKQSPISPEK